jgi:PAS domain S-box-containing protein
MTDPQPRSERQDTAGQGPTVQTQLIDAVRAIYHAGDLPTTLSAGCDACIVACAADRVALVHWPPHTAARVHGPPPLPERLPQTMMAAIHLLQPVLKTPPAEIQALSAAIWPIPPVRLAAFPVDLADQGTAVLLIDWPAGRRRPADWQARLAAVVADIQQRLAQLAATASQPLALEPTADLCTIVDLSLLFSNNIERLIEGILNRLIEANLRGGAIYLFDEQHHRLDLIRSQTHPDTAGDPAGDPAILWRSPLGTYCQELATFAAGQLRPISSNDPAAPVDPLLRHALNRLGSTELISLPLTIGNWLNGIVQIIPVTAGDTHATYEAWAHHIAAAIEHTRRNTADQSTRERILAALDAANDGLLILDEHRRILLANRHLRRIFGLSAQDLISNDFSVLCREFGRTFVEGDRFCTWLARLINSEHDQGLEEFDTIHTEIRRLQCSSSPVIGEDDRRLGHIITFRDTTHAHSIAQLKDDFISTVSHELRTPLTSIQGTLQLVVGQPATGRTGLLERAPDRAARLLAISLNNTERLIRLINDILDASKIEQGRIQLHRTNCQPEQICRRAAEELQVFAADNDSRIDLQVDQNLPLVLADFDRAVQILVNLISNAIKFSPPARRVIVGAQTAGSFVRFSVRDWGQGISSEDQQRLFQKFQQLDSSTTRSVGGAGLGLAISRMLVEQQGGRIWVESERGRGSIFSFSLPIAPNTGSQAGWQQPAHVLLSDVPEALADLFGHGFHRVVRLTYDVLESFAARERPDLIIAGKSVPPAYLERWSQIAPVIWLQPPDGPVPENIHLIDPGQRPSAILDLAQRIIAVHQPLILIVDDDNTVRPILARLIRRHGLRVTQAQNGYDALHLIESHAPDALLLDLHMPGIDGREVLRQIRANPLTAHIPVVVLTANDLSAPLRAEMLALGANAYLEKPVAIDRLIGTLNDVLLHSKALNEDSG